MKTTTFLRNLTLCAALSMPVALQAEETTSAETVIATVNGVEITLGNLIAARRTLPDQYQSIPGAELFRGILDQMVQQEVLRQSIKEETPSLKTQIENELRAIYAGAALQEIARTSVTEEAVQALYNETYADFEPSREFRAAHILVETEEAALALITRLENGEDFADLARQESTGPSGPNGGDLGWFGKGMMVKPFEDAVMTMEPDSVSAPVQTQFGWHVIKLVETRLEDVPPFEEVKVDLAEQLRDKAMREGVEQLTEAAEVDRIEFTDVDAIKNDALLD